MSDNTMSINEQTNAQPQFLADVIEMHALQNGSSETDMSEELEEMNAEDDQLDVVCDDNACFDASCCDAMEAHLIERMRDILRPEVAPACLYERIQHTLDRCCEERRVASSVTHITQVTQVTHGNHMHTTIIHRHIEH
ncbi:hypothetical protein D2E26_0280 [Bifidobacterium dolichotidis]|uniref:Uncharacterized protein n=1 Tax=Bifidobacterium dolichotidis TaxID=2306976 RepID=A0A430FSA6_9BIFI|nr:hypothetical protein [Bifidobacterium dolichotidis]RSX55717.1 hypothetical protein D2E26_0280 [Bifidobacterium dolichotidis]